MICFAADATRAQPAVRISDNTIIVKFRPGAPRDKEPRRQAAAAVNGRITWQGRALHEFAVIEVPRGSAALARAAAAALPQVQYAALDYYGQFAEVQQNCPPNDPLYPQQWYLKNTGQVIAGVAGVPGADIRMEQAWCVPPYGEVSPNIVIAVIDQGVAYIPQLATNLWVNPGEIPGNGLDDDGNGIIDDVHGAAFLPGPNFPNDDCCQGQPQGNPQECGVGFSHWHGTPIAALIGAVGNDGASIAGVSWKCQIMAVRMIMDAPGGWCIGRVPESNWIAGIDYAVAMGAKVLNCSWAVFRPWPPVTIDDPVHDAVVRAGEHGVLAVFAAHNQGWNLDEPWNSLDDQNQPTYISPQYFNTEFDNMIVVGATDHRDRLVTNPPWTWGSNYGQRVDIAAPGVYLRVPDDSIQGGFFGATSGATPLVASVAAQVWSINPTFTPQQVINRILCTARAPIAPAPPLPIRSGGILDAHSALTGTCP